MRKIFRVIVGLIGSFVILALVYNGLNIAGALLVEKLGATQETEAGRNIIAIKGILAFVIAVYFAQKAYKKHMAKGKQREKEKYSMSAVEYNSSLRAENSKRIDELLKEKGNYKIFSWWIVYENEERMGDRRIPLEKWEYVEKGLDIIAQEYSAIKEGCLTIAIEDDTQRYDGGEIASLRIDIKYGYMRPYMKYREEGAIKAEEVKEYMGNTDFDENNNRIGALEFNHDNFIPTSYLTKDISLVKTIFKEFYETGDVSEKYME